MVKERLRSQRELPKSFGDSIHCFSETYIGLLGQELID